MVQIRLLLVIAIRRFSLICFPCRICDRNDIELLESIKITNNAHPTDGLGSIHLDQLSICSGKKENTTHHIELDEDSKLRVLEVDNMPFIFRDALGERGDELGTRYGGVIPCCELDLVLRMTRINEDC